MAEDGGLANLERRIAAISAQARAEIGKALDRGADELAAAAKALAPVDEEDGGALRRSVRKAAGLHALQRRVLAGGPSTTRKAAGKPYDYARANEFGTAEMNAQPFMMPAFRILRRRILNRIGRAVAKAARDQAKRGG